MYEWMNEYWMNAWIYECIISWMIIGTNCILLNWPMLVMSRAKNSSTTRGSSAEWMNEWMNEWMINFVELTERCWWWVGRRTRQPREGHVPNEWMNEWMNDKFCWTDRWWWWEGRRTPQPREGHEPNEWVNHIFYTDRWWWWEGRRTRRPWGSCGEGTRPRSTRRPTTVHILTTGCFNIPYRNTVYMSIVKIKSKKKILLKTQVF